MFGSRDKTIVMNHKLGKLPLHSKVEPNAHFKVELISGTELRAYVRGGGRSWHEVDTSKETPAFWKAIAEFLAFRKCETVMYINSPDVKDLPKRFHKAAKVAV